MSLYMYVCLRNCICELFFAARLHSYQIVVMYLFSLAKWMKQSGNNNNQQKQKQRKRRKNKHCKCGLVNKFQLNTSKVTEHNDVHYAW